MFFSLNRCFSVRCIRSCLPFCSGCLASIRSSTIPNFIHHTNSRDNPATARDANGATSPPLWDEMQRKLHVLLGFGI